MCNVKSSHEHPDLISFSLLFMDSKEHFVQIHPIVHLLIVILKLDYCICILNELLEMDSS